MNYSTVSVWAGLYQTTVWRGRPVNQETAKVSANSSIQAMADVSAVIMYIGPLQDLVLRRDGERALSASSGGFGSIRCEQACVAIIQNWHAAYI